MTRPEWDDCEGSCGGSGRPAATWTTETTSGSTARTPGRRHG